MARREVKRPREEPKWKMVERVSALIEKTLDPSATVEHNVRLPDLQTPGAEPAQCDVLVTTGPPHRRTRTIVEVQRRNKKVNVNDFRGWLEKMRSIGVQHLVCISVKGYPTSVIEKAAQAGPTVRLAALRELKSNDPILSGAFGSIKVNRYTVRGCDRVDFLSDNGGEPFLEAFDHDAPLFRSLGGTTFSLRQIALQLVQRQRAGIKSCPPPLAAAWDRPSRLS